MVVRAGDDRDARSGAAGRPGSSFGSSSFLVHSAQERRPTHFGGDDVGYFSPESSGFSVPQAVENPLAQPQAAEFQGDENMNAAPMRRHTLVGTRPAFVKCAIKAPIL